MYGEKSTRPLLYKPSAIQTRIALTGEMVVKLLLMIILLYASTAQAEYNVSDRVTDEEYGSDYIFHYAAGAVISGVTWYYLPDDWHPVARWVTSVAASVLVKTVIESFDDPFDSRDILDYGLGGAISVTILEISF